MAFLEQRQMAPLEGLRVAVRGGSVILRGNMRSPHEKLLIAQCCRRVAGVVNVIDILNVQPLTRRMLPHAGPIHVNPQARTISDRNARAVNS